ncbi:MAG: hypothetical protein ACKVP4_03270 [Hyphomicrobium sp.]
MKSILTPMFVLVVALGGASAFAAEMSKEIIAAQIRKQGHQCVNPQSATRDDAASKPDETYWMLTCENASYRVRLIPKMAAQVEKLGDAPAK